VHPEVSGGDDASGGVEDLVSGLFGCERVGDRQRFQPSAARGGDRDEGEHRNQSRMWRGGHGKCLSVQADEVVRTVGDVK
jgi:hypothetical protein